MKAKTPSAEARGGAASESSESSEGSAAAAFLQGPAKRRRPRSLAAGSSSRTYVGVVLNARSLRPSYPGRPHPYPLIWSWIRGSTTPRSRVVTNRDERCPLLDDARIPQKELKTCRPIGIAAIALVMSIGLFVASTTLTTLAAYRVEPTNFNIDLISVGLTAVILYLVDVLLLLFFCLSPYDWGSNQKAISLAIGLGAALDSCIFLICINIWKRPMVIYNSPFMAHLKKITCAVMTLLLKVLLAVLMVGVVFIMGCWEILKAVRVLGQGGAQESSSVSAAGGQPPQQSSTGRSQQLPQHSSDGGTEQHSSDGGTEQPHHSSDGGTEQHSSDGGTEQQPRQSQQPPLGDNGIV
uniref:Uncharacterized protein n=1 Tax=Oryza meridionalis TaxID=40149 RepID=A0A0E0F3Q2_9ORYZ